MGKIILFLVFYVYRNKKKNFDFFYIEKKKKFDEINLFFFRFIYDNRRILEEEGKEEI